MIRNVSIGSEYNNFGQSSKDIENVIKYSMGTTIVAQEESPFSGMGIMVGLGGAMEAFKGGKWLWNNRKDIKGGWGKFAEETKAQNAAFNNAGGYKSLDAYKITLNEHRAKTINEMIPTGDKFEKLNPETQKAYNATKEAAEYAAKNPQESNKAFKMANTKLAEANKMAHDEYMAKEATSFFGKLAKGFKKITGISALNGELKTLATKSPITAKLLKYGKGNGLFLAITGLTELFTQIIPAFKLGADKGVIQTTKSAVNTGASIGGWVVGSAIGAQGGAMLGAAIGSVGGPVGTVFGGVLGSVVGLIGGCVGSWAAMKVSKAFVGESEVEKAKEKQAKEMAKEVSKDPKAVQELVATAEQKLNSEGIESEDAKVAFTSIKKLAQLTPPQTDMNSTNNPFNKETPLEA